jgi:hypothetical protein
MEIMKVVVFVLDAVIILKESTVTNVRLDSIDHWANIGTKLTFVNLANVIISIQLEIVLKKLVIVNVVLKDISAIQIVDHVNVISMEHLDVIVNLLMDNVHVEKTLVEISVKNVHLVTMDILSVNLAIVKELVQLEILVKNQLDNVNVDLDTADNNVINAKMDITIIQHVFHVVVTCLEQLKKFAIKILEVACVKKDMEVQDVINVFLDISVSLIASPVIVLQLEVSKQFVMQQENARVYKILPVNVVNNV